MKIKQTIVPIEELKKLTKKQLTDCGIGQTIWPKWEMFNVPWWLNIVLKVKAIRQRTSKLMFVDGEHLFEYLHVFGKEYAKMYTSGKKVGLKRSDGDVYEALKTRQATLLYA